MWEEFHIKFLIGFRLTKLEAKPCRVIYNKQLFWERGVAHKREVITSVYTESGT